MAFDINSIGQLRRKIGLTQTQLARLSGVSQSLIAKIERGKIDPAHSKVIAIFEALENEINKKEKAKTAKEIMSKKVSYVKPEEKLDKIIKLMKEKDISQLPVFKNGNPVGSISENMFMDWIEKYGDSVGKIKVEEVMNDCFPSVTEEAHLEAVAQLLRYYKAVLVKKKGTVTGIITKADLIKAMK